MLLVMQANILSPILTKKRSFHRLGCKWEISKPFRGYWIKSCVQQPENVFAYSSYSGELTVTYKCKTAEQAKHKLRSLRRIKNIGRFRNSGMGAIEWTNGKLLLNPKKHTKWNRRKIRIRKGLPSNLPRAIQDLILYELLHDFYVTRLHSSKIYVEPDIQNQQLKSMLQRSHDPTDHILIKVNKRYDGWAAKRTRTLISPQPNRYNWKSYRSSQLVNFQQLADEIKGFVNDQNVFKLYEFIHHSKELVRLNEALKLGHTSLRNHLLLMVNMTVRDYLDGRLDAFIRLYGKDRTEFLTLRR